MKEKVLFIKLNEVPELHKAILRSDFYTVKRILKQYTDCAQAVNRFISLEKFNGTPLLLACSSVFNSLASYQNKSDQEINKIYRAAIVKILLSKGANPNTSTREGIYPLHLATQEKSLDIIIQLVQGGADINQRDSHGFTPLHYAVNGDRNEEIIEYFLNNHADRLAQTFLKKSDSINNLNNLILKFTSYELAAAYGKKNIVQQIINWQDHNGKSLLHDAVEDKNIKLAMQLLNFGAQVNLKTYTLAQDEDEKLDKMSLHIAIENDDLEMVNLLMRYGANINGCDCLLETPLHYAVSKKSISIMQKLLDCNCEVNVRNETGVTPLALAFCLIEELDVLQEITKLLIVYGADINIPDNVGCTILADCVLNSFSLNQSEKVEFLLTMPGIEMNIANNCGATPLNIACNKNNFLIMQLLSNAGAF